MTKAALQVACGAVLLVGAGVRIDAWRRRAGAGVGPPNGARSRILISLGLAVLALVTHANAMAQQPKVEVAVVPTEVEWAQLPPYCRARYSITLYAKGTPFEGRVPPAEVKRWQQQMGDAAWNGLHHYCYGLIQLSRAPLVSDPQRRAFVYGRAVDEFTFVYDSISKSEPFAAEIAVRLGLTYKAINRMKDAMRYVDEALRINPNLEAAYSAKALILRQQGSLEDAAQTLLAGLEIDGDSAELNYFLGLTYLDLHRVDLAKTYADKAYSLGYPLPGLRNKLARAERQSR